MASGATSPKHCPTRRFASAGVSGNGRRDCIPAPDFRSWPPNVRRTYDAPHELDPGAGYPAHEHRGRRNCLWFAEIWSREGRHLQAGDFPCRSGTHHHDLVSPCQAIPDHSPTSRSAEIAKPRFERRRIGSGKRSVWAGSRGARLDPAQVCSPAFRLLPAQPPPSRR